jgi:hypothetical protein
VDCPDPVHDPNGWGVVLSTPAAVNPVPVHVHETAPIEMVLVPLDKSPADTTVNVTVLPAVVR